MRTALITGISGQDGAYLAQFLLEKGYRIIGTTRDAGAVRFPALERLGLIERLEIVSMAPSDFKSTLTALSRAGPDEIYHLAGQSSVGLSFEQPSETIDSIVTGALNILESIRFLGMSARLYNASSSECFGDTAGIAAQESTAFNPVSPYGVAKSAAHWLVRNYREAHGMYAASGILFNHESPLRPARFVTQKIVQAAYRISRGSKETLTLGNLDIYRDWGWAPEYVEAMWRILQADAPEDFVIATGETHSLREFVELAFSSVGLDWREHVKHDPQLMRPNDIPWSQGDPAKAGRVLGWRATRKLAEVIAELGRSVTAQSEAVERGR